MNLVYPYRLGNNSDELFRYSLRSSCAHMPVESVTVIGDRPEWLSKAARYIPHARMGTKYLDGVHKQIIASNLLHDGDRYVVMNDDFILLAPHQPAHRFRGLLSERRHLYNGDYRKAAERVLAICGDQALDFACHCPYPVHAEMMRDLLREQYTGEPMHVRSLYANTCYDGAERIAEGDKKAFKLDDLDRVIAREDWFSVGDDTPLVRAVISMCRERFPDRTRWER